MHLEPGQHVILVLHSPREKLFAKLGEINTAGVYARCIDLEYFEDWCSAIAEDEPYLPMSDYFLPMWRIEKIMRDEGTPPMVEQFRTRTGRDISSF